MVANSSDQPKQSNKLSQSLQREQAVGTASETDVLGQLVTLSAKTARFAFRAGQAP